MKKDPIKNKGSRVLTRLSPLKVCGVFSNAQGQLTPQSVVESFRISNSSKILWLSSIPARMKKIMIKNEDIRLLTRLYVVFFRRSRAAYSEVSGRILPKFELIQAFIVVL